VDPWLRVGFCALLAGTLLTSSACTVGPGYKRPTAAVPICGKAKDRGKRRSEGCHSEGCVVAAIS